MYMYSKLLMTLQPLPLAERRLTHELKESTNLNSSSFLSLDAKIISKGTPSFFSFVYTLARFGVNVLHGGHLKEIVHHDLEFQTFHGLTGYRT